VKLPNHAQATVAKAKITKYLLSTTHPRGRSKARVFTALGFTASEWQAFATALQRDAAEHDVTKVEDSPFGTRYTVEGLMRAPDGRTPTIRSVWFIERGETAPRFVTAYPREGRRV